MRVICKYLFILYILFSAATSYAQSNHRISGSVIDSAKNAVSDASIVVIVGKDTLKTESDVDGDFEFSRIKGETFLLSIKALGYHPFQKTYQFGKERHLEIPKIELRASVNLLNTVEIKGKINPIRVLQDTIEYNAAAFQVFDGDNVADLLKQFPGLEVDADYNVKTMGKDMVKLRVNGEDFFTNNINDFIGKLPAGMVAKIQIIDDYGDEANFTGLKIGEPQKLLNIVTKPGMDSGRFGSANIKGGTNQSIGGSSSFNLWKGKKQNMTDFGYQTSDNGAGKSSSGRLTVNMRDKIKDSGQFGVAYSLGTGENAYENSQAVETINPIGTFFNNSESNGSNKQNRHSLTGDYKYENKETRFGSILDLRYNSSNNRNLTFNSQYGIIRQDLINQSNSRNRSPQGTMSLNFTRLLNNKKSSLSGNFVFSSDENVSQQHISTNILYYDQVTEILKKDSLLSRDLVTDNSRQNFDLKLTYSVGLKSPKDSLAKQSLNFIYNASLGLTNSDFSTYVLKPNSFYSQYVDSLSTQYKSLFLNQTFGLNFQYSNKKIRYNVGFNVRPSLMDNNYRNLNQNIQTYNLNYSPNLNLSRLISKGKTLSISYSGINNSPTLNQLQPIRNTLNLQNVIIGNPRLKPYFKHNLNSNYNVTNVKSGISFQSGINFSATQNEIVTNAILVSDTLNSLKQETRFENTNGTYSTGANYLLGIPLQKNKYNISVGGSLGFSNRAVFVNDHKRFNKGINASQQIRASMILKKFSLNSSASYTFSSNTNIINSSSLSDLYYYTLGQIGGSTFFNTHQLNSDLRASLRLKNFTATSDLSYNITHSDAKFNANTIRDVKTFDAALSTKITLKRTYFVGFTASKRINTGYALSNINPLIINASLTKSFMKNRALNLSFNANDLLNQGNNLSRYVSGNSIIDSRTNQITRVFSFSLSYNISKFGNNSFWVDEDE